MDGALLRESRQLVGLTAQDVADACGVTARSVERAETRIVRRTTFDKYARAVARLSDERQRAVRKRLIAAGVALG